MIIDLTKFPVKATTVFPYLKIRMTGKEFYEVAFGNNRNSIKQIVNTCNIFLALIRSGM